MKYLGLALVAIMLVGCGSDKKTTTYTQEAPVLPDAPGGTTLIAQADNAASAGLSYTEVGDGSVLVNCGDDCNVQLFEALIVTDDAVGAIDAATSALHASHDSSVCTQDSTCPQL